MTILDRYILKKFATPFLYCFLGFIGIWFIFDLSDNLPDFIQGKASFEMLVEYYASQIPQLVVVCLPIGLLLGLLYSLTAMSRSNEIISMLGAGLSVVRILIPLIVVGVFLSVVTAIFNFSGAPHAAAAKKQMVRDIKRGEKRTEAVFGHLFRNREAQRTWFMRRINIQRGKIGDIQILQQNADGDILQQWYAREANYQPEQKRWVLSNARYVELSPEGDITKSELKDTLIIDGWNETPWRILSSVMNPEYLAVPELRDYLTYNSDFPEKRLAAYRTHLHYRWALSLFCLVVVFLAAPMGIVYSRRGILGGVALAIGLFFSMVFMSSLFIALGKGQRISPFVAAWGPVIFFFAIGLVLVWFRSTNRDLPKLRIPGF
ncbi:MAG: LptF/LptG family permease [Chthoniobacterales bacterium]|nr:LptF/LptG family permease [Chthoniobacterales bacterium]